MEILRSAQNDIVILNKVKDLSAAVAPVSYRLDTVWAQRIACVSYSDSMASKQPAVVSIKRRYFHAE
jgi:hypothetical protein